MEATCDFEGCTNRLLCKGWCVGHYTQQRRGKPLAPLRKINSKPHRDERGKVCTGCETYKLYEEFYANSAGADGRLSRCKECQKRATLADYYRRREEKQDELRGTTEGIPGSLSSVQRA